MMGGGGGGRGSQWFAQRFEEPALKSLFTVFTYGVMYISISEGELSLTTRTVFSVGFVCWLAA